MNQQHQQQPSLNTTYQSGLIGHQNLLENSPVNIILFLKINPKTIQD